MKRRGREKEGRREVRKNDREEEEDKATKMVSGRLEREKDKEEWKRKRKMMEGRKGEKGES